MAQQEKIRLSLENIPLHALQPGLSTNFMLKLENLSPEKQSILIKTSIPEGWSEIMRYNSAELEATSKLLKIVSFYIPEGTRLGSYPVIVSIYLKNSNEMACTDSFNIQIDAKYKFNLAQVQTKDYAFDSDTFSVSYLLRNQSNTTGNFKLIIINGTNTEFRYYTLKPDSTIIDKVFVKPTKNTEKQTRKNILVVANFQDAKLEPQKTSFSYELFPSKSAHFDRFERLPIRISGMFASSNQRGIQEYAGLFDIVGNGWINQQKKQFLSFQFKGPNRNGDPILGSNDAYYVRYKSKNHHFLVGDNSYSLSKLSENSRMGRGIEYRYTSEDFSFGGYVNLPRYYPQIKALYAAFIEMKPMKNLLLSSGGLVKTFTNDEPAVIVNAGAQYVPADWGSFDAEFATGYHHGQISKAIQASTRLTFKRIRFNASAITADANFPGYYSNTRNITAGTNLLIIKKLTANFNYSTNSSNIALDTLYANAPVSSSMNAGLSFSLNDHLSFTLGASHGETKDRMETPVFNYFDNVLNSGFNLSFSTTNINLTGGYGIVTDLLEDPNGIETSSLRGALQFRHSFSTYFSVDGSLRYQEKQHLLIETMKDLNYSFGMNFTHAKARISLKYQSNYLIEDYHKDRSLLDLNTTLRFHENHELGAVLNYNLEKNSFDQKTLRFLIRYTYTLNFPIAKKDNIGKLEGRLINHGIPSVEGIMLSFAGATAITDKEGKFTISSVPAGQNTLFINNSSIGINSIAEEPGPYIIQIVPGETNTFELGYTLSSVVKGFIDIVQDDNLDNINYVSFGQNFENILIEISTEKEMFRTISDENGHFVLNDLRPGTWRIKAYSNGLPKGYELERDSFDLVLKAGETQEVTIRIRKKARKVKFQQSIEPTKN